MPSPQFQQNSASDEGPQQVTDQRKRRMLSNRESARRSRMRKQKHLDDLLTQVTQLKTENNQILTQVDVATQHFMKLESENTILRTQVMELTERLQYLNSVLLIMEEVSGVTMDIPEIPDPLLRPWQLPCPSLPIMASQDDCHAFPSCSVQSLIPCVNNQLEYCEGVISLAHKCRCPSIPAILN